MRRGSGDCGLSCEQRGEMSVIIRSSAALTDLYALSTLYMLIHAHRLTVDLCIDLDV